MFEFGLWIMLMCGVVIATLGVILIYESVIECLRKRNEPWGIYTAMACTLGFTTSIITVLFLIILLTDWVWNWISYLF